MSSALRWRPENGHTQMHIPSRQCMPSIYNISFKELVLNLILVFRSIIGHSSPVHINYFWKYRKVITSSIVIKAWESSQMFTNWIQFRHKARKKLRIDLHCSNKQVTEIRVDSRFKWISKVDWRERSSLQSKLSEFRQNL